jgi:hypothetical protein
MSESSSESSRPDRENIKKQFGPQDEGLKETRNPLHKLQNGQAWDGLEDTLNNTSMDRRSFLARTGSLLGLGATAAILKGRQGRSEHTPPPPQSTPNPEVVETPVELENGIQFLAKEGDQLEYSDVAQYYDANFKQPADGLGKPIFVRNEHKQNSNKSEELTADEMNNHQIGVIRVAGINQDNARPQDSFIDEDKNYVYEWLVLVRLTDDPQQPYVYVDGQGNVTEEPWFISPNFANLTDGSLQVIDPPKPEALQ